MMRILFDQLFAYEDGVLITKSRPIRIGSNFFKPCTRQKADEIEFKGMKLSQLVGHEVRVIRNRDGAIEIVGHSVRPA